MIQRVLCKLWSLTWHTLCKKTHGAALLALVLTNLAFADESESKNANPIPGSIASNQPIAVDAEISAKPTTAVDPQPVQESLAPPIVPDSNEVSKEPAPSYTSSTLVRRAREITQSATPQATDERPWYRSTLVSLSVVLALIGAAYCGVRKLVPSLRAPQRSELIRVLARTALTPKQHVALVQCGRRVVLIGVSPDRVETLSEITDPTEVSELTIGETAIERKSNAAGTFGKWFDKEQDSYTESTDTTLDVALQESVAAPIRSNTKGTKPPLKELLERVRALGA